MILKSQSAKPAILFFLVLSNTLFAQQLVFDMSAFGITFGKMTVNKVKENDSTDLYTLRAKGYLKILWMERDDETLHEVRYRNGKLFSSTYTQIESKKIKKWTNVSFDGSKYVVDSYRGKRTFTEVPVFSILTLYFSNPANIQRVFYEAEANFTTLMHPDKNTVEMKTSDGSRSVYRFVNDVLREMEFHISIATVYMKRIN